MPKADPTPTTSRRALLAHVPALAAMTAAVPGCIPTPARAAETGPDAELIALCARHIVNLTAYNTYGGHLEPEDDPLCAAYEETRDAVEDAEPQTMAGVLAVARAAKAEARQPDGSYDFDVGIAWRWASHLVDDLLRLNEEGLV